MDDDDLFKYSNMCVTLSCRDLNPVANYACRMSICKDIALGIACAPNTMRGVLKMPIFQSLYASYCSVCAKAGF